MTDHEAPPLPWQLAMHLISAHCDGIAIGRDWAGNADQHKHEHDGPGTIRDHPRGSLHFDADEIEEVLAESEEDLAVTGPGQEIVISGGKRTLCGT